jgi:hypothetical protein
MTLDGRRVTYYQSFAHLLFPKLPLPALRDPSILSAEDTLPFYSNPASTT